MLHCHVGLLPGLPRMPSRWALYRQQAFLFRTSDSCDVSIVAALLGCTAGGKKVSPCSSNPSFPPSWSECTERMAPLHRRLHPTSKPTFVPLSAAVQDFVPWPNFSRRTKPWGHWYTSNPWEYCTTVKSVSFTQPGAKSGTTQDFPAVIILHR